MSDDEIYEYLGRVFEWSRVKAMKNALKHGVRFTDAATIFFDEYALFRSDPDHSDDEDRYILIGRTSRGGSLVVAHVYRGEKTRIISARKAKSFERSEYESGLGRHV
jgi:uncharacterized DUF497 family protein